ncbi:MULTISPECIES: hypothetical protein [Bacillus]|uniref:Uncharacterized protein n=2 Tax=Bacillus thuringiensis TaxID=1428 RepID=A0AAP4Q733_BACTU|nr:MULTISPECIES: hypothetical protein [Bacillus]MEC0046518.1 hypothetical protein [Bacillus cereus]AFV21887.1 hypothetical protein BTB_502p05820 [Bacillus thuringiensis Bt407]ERI00935.1 hypothetical protein BTCBT_002490 [Bacillus thuringiensis T01-328]MBN6707702.1 hypothetical protein [Bacillus thuringiensis]MDN7078470.1 hypothetical protein [Bacillus thuringiensis]
MEYIDFEELIGDTVKEGDKVWICDYRHNNILESAIRHVPPQEVAVIDNAKLPKNKTVYYSSYHFRPLGKKGAPLSKIIVPYDNTGYRSITGISLNIFFTEEECRQCYKKQCEVIKEQIEYEKKRVENSMNLKMEDVNKEMLEHC